MAADEPGEKILYALIYHTDVQETRGLTPALAPMASIAATFNARGRQGRPRSPRLSSRVAPMLAIGIG
jgi:hypothetical protein